MMSDLVSRQAAIDAFNTNLNELAVGGEENAKTVENYLNRVLDKIKCLPSVQPETYWKEQCQSYEKTINKMRESLSAQPEIIRKPVIGYEGYYEVDNCGRVYALNRVIHVEDHGRSYDKPLVGGIIKQHMHSKGYKIVPLTRDGKTKNVFVHRIVAMAFLANPNKLPCVNHKDEDKTNNFAENLEWCTYQYNNAYGSKPKKHSKWMSGRKLSDEHKQHISDGHKRHWDKIRAERGEETE
jgi:hypothetical protein